MTTAKKTAATKSQKVQAHTDKVTKDAFAQRKPRSVKALARPAPDGVAAKKAVKRTPDLPPAPVKNETPATVITEAAPPNGYKRTAPTQPGGSFSSLPYTTNFQPEADMPLKVMFGGKEFLITERIATLFQAYAERITKLLPMYQGWASSLQSQHPAASVRNNVEDYERDEDPGLVQDAAVFLQRLMGYSTTADKEQSAYSSSRSFITSLNEWSFTFGQEEKMPPLFFALIVLEDVFKRGGKINKHLQERIKAGAFEAITMRLTDKIDNCKAGRQAEELVSMIAQAYKIPGVKEGVPYANLYRNPMPVFDIMKGPDSSEEILKKNLSALAFNAGLLLGIHHEVNNYLKEELKIQELNNQFILNGINQLISSLPNYGEADEEGGSARYNLTSFLSQAFWSLTSIISSIGTAAVKDAYLFDSERAYLDMVKYGHLNFQSLVTNMVQGNKAAWKASLNSTALTITPLPLLTVRPHQALQNMDKKINFY